MKSNTFRSLPVRLAAVSRGIVGALAVSCVAICVGLLLGYGSERGTYSQTPDSARRATLPQFIGGIVTRSASIIYVTEQDSEVFAFYRNTPVKELTEGSFLGLLRRPADTPIFRQSWPAFFQIRTQNDPSGRWSQLQQHLESQLTDPTIFRIPRDEPYDAQYDLYAVGLFNGATVVGVQMFGVAT